MPLPLNPQQSVPTTMPKLFLRKFLNAISSQTLNSISQSSFLIPVQPFIVLTIYVPKRLSHETLISQCSVSKGEFPSQSTLIHCSFSTYPFVILGILIQSHGFKYQHYAKSSLIHISSHLSLPSPDSSSKFLSLS